MATGPGSDSRGVEFWQALYEKGRTPWDLGAPHPELASRLDRDLLGRRALGHGARAFVPGCGRGHDALALARAGWIVTAQDLVQGIGREVEEALEPYGGRFLSGNALDFTSTPPFELLWEHTFFCGLPPDLRPSYGEMARRLVAYRGRLAALVFPTDRPQAEGGPPYRMTTEDLAASLGEAFDLVEDGPVEHKGHRWDWGERFAVFRRRDDPD